MEIHRQQAAGKVIKSLLCVQGVTRKGFAKIRRQ